MSKNSELWTFNKREKRTGEKGSRWQEEHQRRLEQARGFKEGEWVMNFDIPVKVVGVDEQRAQVVVQQGNKKAYSCNPDVLQHIKPKEQLSE